MLESKPDSDVSTSNGPTHQSLDEFAMLTMLLHLTSALTNQDHDISIRELNYAAGESAMAFFESVASESSLSWDTINAMLVWDGRQDVISACYMTNSQVSITILEDGDDFNLEDPSLSAIDRTSPVILGSNAKLRVPLRGKGFWSEIKEQADDWYCAKL